MSKKHTSKKPTPVSMLPNVPRYVYHFIRDDYSPYGMVFDFFNEKAIDYIWEKIEERGSVINICFTYISKNPKFNSKVVSAIEFDSPIDHTEIYFGEHVCRLVLTDGGAYMYHSPSEKHSLCEMVSLPFNNSKKVVDTGVNILRRSYSMKGGKPIAIFDYHPTEMVEHFINRLFFRGHGENDFDIQGDYDPLFPETWTRGMHCSQFVLLFLKRCVMENVLDIDPLKKKHFLNLYSFTCLPSGLRSILREIWPKANSEFIDYAKHPQNWN